MTTFLEEYRPLFMTVTFGFLGIAFCLTYRSSSRSRIITLNKAMLWAVTGITLLFLFFPQAITAPFADRDALTAEMDRTLISIEGMT